MDFFECAGRSVQKGHLAQKRIGCTAGELLEILDEMGLVEVSTVGRQVGPLNRSSPQVDLQVACPRYTVCPQARWLGSGLAGRVSERRD